MRAPRRTTASRTPCAMRQPFGRHRPTTVHRDACCKVRPSAQRCATVRPQDNRCQVSGPRQASKFVDNQAHPGHASLQNGQTPSAEVLNSCQCCGVSVSPPAGSSGLTAQIFLVCRAAAPGRQAGQHRERERGRERARASREREEERERGEGGRSGRGGRSVAAALYGRLSNRRRHQRAQPQN